MAIDQILNVLFPMLGVVVGATLQYWFSKTSEARRHKRKFLELQISHLLLPLFIQFKNIEIETYGIERYPNEQSFLDELFDNIEIEKIIINNLYLASPKLSYYLLEFIYNSYSLESEDGIKEYRSTYGEGEEGEYGYIDAQMVFDNYQTLKKIIFDEYDEKVRLYQKSYIETEKKWSFIWSALERIRVRRRNPPKRQLKRHLNRS